jgi:hypothetical protein
MSSQALTGYGTVFKWNDQTVAEITNISLPDRKSSILDATSLDTVDNYSDIRPGRIDASKITLKGWLRPDDTNGQIALGVDQIAKTLRAWEVAGASGAFSLTGSGYVTGWKPGDINADGLVDITIEISCSGASVFAATYADQLSALSVTTGTLYPTFAPGTYIYTAVTTGATVTVTPTCAGATSITVNGAVVPTGTPSGAISAGAAGTNTAIEVRCKVTGKVDRVYKITLVKTA